MRADQMFEALDRKFFTVAQANFITENSGDILIHRSSEVKELGLVASESDCDEVGAIESSVATVLAAAAAGTFQPTGQGGGGEGGVGTVPTTSTISSEKPMVVLKSVMPPNVVKTFAKTIDAVVFLGGAQCFSQVLSDGTACNGWMVCRSDGPSQAKNSKCFL
jgi:hypothetical protein